MRVDTSVIVHAHVRVRGKWELTSSTWPSSGFPDQTSPACCVWGPDLNARGWERVFVLRGRLLGPHTAPLAGARFLGSRAEWSPAASGAGAPGCQGTDWPWPDSPRSPLRAASCQVPRGPPVYPPAPRASVISRWSWSGVELKTFSLPLCVGTTPHTAVVNTASRHRLAQGLWMAMLANAESPSSTPSVPGGGSLRAPQAQTLGSSARPHPSDGSDRFHEWTHR